MSQVTTELKLPNTTSCWRIFKPRQNLKYIQAIPNSAAKSPIQLLTKTGGWEKLNQVSKVVMPFSSMYVHPTVNPIQDTIAVTVTAQEGGMNQEEWRQETADQIMRLLLGYYLI